MERKMKKQKEIDPSKPPFHWCPRFDFCSANRCPFDPKIEGKTTLKGEEKCKLAKSRRMRLWESLPEEKKALLTYRGMFKREFSARKRWQDLPEEEKARRMAKLVKFQKGHFIHANQEQDQK
jgi:hypothetical protein